MKIVQARTECGKHTAFALRKNAIVTPYSGGQTIDNLDSWQTQNHKGRETFFLILFIIFPTSTRTNPDL